LIKFVIFVLRSYIWISRICSDVTRRSRRHRERDYVIFTLVTWLIHLCR